MELVKFSIVRFTTAAAILLSVIMVACAGSQRNVAMNPVRLEFERFLSGEESLVIEGEGSAANEIHKILVQGNRTGMPYGSPVPDVKYLLRDLSLEERSVIYFREDFTPLNFTTSKDDLDRLVRLLQDSIPNLNRKRSPKHRS